MAQNPIERLRALWDRLAVRERRLVLVLAAVLGVGGVGSVGATIVGGMSDLEAQNATTREALRDLDVHRDQLLAAYQAESALEGRVPASALALTSYLDQTSKAVGISIPEMQDNPPAPIGKKYVERSVRIQMRGITVDQLGSFMQQVEGGQQLVVIKKLSVRPRYDQHDQLDVDMTVATYERASGSGSTAKSGAPT